MEKNFCALRQGVIGVFCVAEIFYFCINVPIGMEEASAGTYTLYQVPLGERKPQQVN